jgi:hypothetical protein
MEENGVLFSYQNNEGTIMKDEYVCRDERRRAIIWTIPGFTYFLEEKGNDASQHSYNTSDSHSIRSRRGNRITIFDRCHGRGFCRLCFHRRLSCCLNGRVCFAVFGRFHITGGADLKGRVVESTDTTSVFQNNRNVDIESSRRI